MQEGADIAHLVERLARRAGVLPFAVYDSLLKFYASTDGARAAHLFREMIDEGLAASEGFCGSLISRSGESNSVAFAEDVANYLRGKSMMSLALLKTLMKACVGGSSGTVSWWEGIAVWIHAWKVERLVGALGLGALSRVERPAAPRSVEGSPVRAGLLIVCVHAIHEPMCLCHPGCMLVATACASPGC